MSGKQEEWSRIGVNVRCHSCGLPLLCETFKGWKSVCGCAYNLQDIQVKFSVFLLFYCSSFHGKRSANPVVVGDNSIININK